jgi:flagellar biosynthesis/type III secretory pathway protein FliH
MVEPNGLQEERRTMSLADELPLRDLPDRTIRQTLAELLGEPKELHAFAPDWKPLIWSLADQDPETLLTSSSEWLKAMAVFRVEDVEAEAFREVFARAVADIAPLANVDPVGWNDLMRMLLTWAFWRRPNAERAALVAEAEAHQTHDLRRREIEAMNQKLGPSLVQLSYAEGKKEGKEEGRMEGEMEGEKKGELRATRALLRALLENHFGAVPEALVQRIEAAEDLVRLKAAALQVHQLQKPEDLPL